MFLTFLKFQGDNVKSARWNTSLINTDVERCCAIPDEDTQKEEYCIDLLISEY